MHLIQFLQWWALIDDFSNQTWKKKSTNDHGWPNPASGLGELAPPPFSRNTIARGLSYASGRGLCRGQLIPEANYLAWVKTMTLRRPPNQSTSEIVSDNDQPAATSSIRCCQQSYTATQFYWPGIMFLSRTNVIDVTIVHTWDGQW